MGLILKIGLGIKKIVFPIGGKKFGTIEEVPLNNGKIRVKKTNSVYVNNNSFIEQYKFCFYDKEEKLGSYLLGNPEGENNFYVQEIRSLKSNLPSNYEIKFFYEKIKLKFSKSLKNSKKDILPSCERNLLYLWNYSKKYLKEKGIEKLLTQAEFELVDTAEIDFKLGWQDVDRNRQIEKFVGNQKERKKHYTLLEKITGALYLEYYLK
ncbi:hypothetical protein COU58_03150 [Candidatus Pacearchaeota archaeon CG10_big_fil_rev_8_21_14_0_10_32_42]|nr:MAG: hypothetical protein COU58_03150 [Candidatus Pacearchaeota archaeon CG10_big_fil_rev_8_21_14_0_10_32_42]